MTLTFWRRPFVLCLRTKKKCPAIFETCLGKHIYRLTFVWPSQKSYNCPCTRRMRIIKIADRSGHGWNMIAEYENDELTLDSGDEKRLIRAEMEAEKKAARKKLKLPAAIAPAAAGDVVPPICRFGAAPPVPAKIGTCFGCGEFGHLRRYCSKPAALTSSASVV